MKSATFPRDDLGQVTFLFHDLILESRLLKLYVPIGYCEDKMRWKKTLLFIKLKTVSPLKEF